MIFAALRAGLAFADAFDLGRVQGIDFVAALAMILVADAQREIEQRAEARLERVVGGDLAADVADDAAQSGAQELELARCRRRGPPAGRADNRETRVVGQFEIRTL